MLLHQRLDAGPVLLLRRAKPVISQYEEVAICLQTFEEIVDGGCDVRECPVLHLDESRILSFRRENMRVPIRFKKPRACPIFVVSARLFGLGLWGVMRTVQIPRPRVCNG